MTDTNDAPKIDTTAPEQLGTARTLVERIARVIEDGDLFAPAMRKPVGAVIRALLDERDLAAAQTAAAWIAGRDAAVRRMNDDPTGKASVSADNYPGWFCGRYKSASELTPPADGQAALDRLIAERVRYERREAFEEAADIVEKECNRILSKQDGTIAQVDANLRLIALLLPDIEAALRARGSKEGRDG